MKACVKYLLMSESRGEMIDKFQKEFEGIWPRDFVNYFKERVLPKANRLGKWALGEVNIYDESFFNHAGKSNVGNIQNVSTELCVFRVSTRKVPLKM